MKSQDNIISVEQNRHPLQCCSVVLYSVMKHYSFRNNILLIILLSFITVSCSNYIHIPTKINKTSEKGREGLWAIKNDTTYNMLTFIYYKANIESGKYIRIHDNGQIACIGRYKNGKKYGIWRSFMNNGSGSSKMRYKKGEGKLITLYNPSW